MKILYSVGDIVVFNSENYPTYEWRVPKHMCKNLNLYYEDNDKFSNYYMYSTKKYKGNIGIILEIGEYLNIGYANGSQWIEDVGYVVLFGDNKVLIPQIFLSNPEKI